MDKKSLSVWIVGISLGCGIAADLLFRGQGWGINFPLFSGLVLAGGFFVAKTNGVKFATENRILIAAILIFSIAGLWRRAPFSLVLSALLVLVLMTLLALNYAKGNWKEFQLADYLGQTIQLPFLGWRAFRSINDQSDEASSRKTFGAIVRGLLISLPVLLVLGSLLASADYYFAEWLEEFFSWINVGNFFELLWRAIWIFIVAILVLVAYAYAIKRSPESKPFTVNLPRFIGFTETSIVLSSVILLFTVFVISQFRYFFGGASNISTNAFTYAQYARRGFGEMVLVAIFTIALYMAFSLITKKNSQRQERSFTGMSIALFALVSVILVSAFQRLQLYESVYGFTRTRTNVHVFMIFLGLFFVTLVAVELLGKRKNFTLLLLAASSLYIGTLLVLNVDAFVVRANIVNHQENEIIDVAYLASLSENAVPVIWEGIQEQGESTQALIAALGCRSANQSRLEAGASWQSFTFAGKAADEAVEAFGQSSFANRLGESGQEGISYPEVQVDGEVYSCLALFRGVED